MAEPEEPATSEEDTVNPTTKHLLRHPIRRFRLWLGITVLRHLLRAVAWAQRKVMWRYGMSEDRVTVTLDGERRTYVIRVIPESRDREDREKVAHADMCDLWRTPWEEILL